MDERSYPCLNYVAPLPKAYHCGQGQSTYLILRTSSVGRPLTPHRAVPVKRARLRAAMCPLEGRSTQVALWDSDPSHSSFLFSRTHGRAYWRTHSKAVIEFPGHFSTYLGSVRGLLSLVLSVSPSARRSQGCTFQRHPACVCHSLKQEFCLWMF